jgi:hypothetical protein
MAESEGETAMPSLVGIWKLVECRAFDDADGERIMAMGSDGRVELPQETKRAFVAYCGRYTFDGTKLATRVDGASGPDMMEDQVRHIRFDGSKRMVAVPVSRLFGRGGGLELVWERCD